MNVNLVSLGNILKHRDQYWIVAKKEHVKPGKGGAFVQLELKNVISGSKSNERFRAGEEIEKVSLDERDFQYLYSESDSVFLMDSLSYEQEQFSKNLMEGEISFLVSGMNVRVCYCDDMVIAIKLPETVTLRVKETEPVLRGQTAAASYKPAVLENGIRVMVPPFVKADDIIVVRTADSIYVERVK
ncbi:MAG: elongation factor P [Rickettsiales bacterium]|jgi:elongation factor P|nr:elongation factor P [Rickettsiales bacterium]